MNSYEWYKDPCARCNRELPLRDMNKIMYCKSHMVNAPARKLCYVCDDCLAAMLDFLDVPEPEEKDRPYTLPRFCRKCYTNVGKRARYCPHCGADLDHQNKEDVT